MFCDVLAEKAPPSRAWRPKVKYREDVEIPTLRKLTIEIPDEDTSGQTLVIPFVSAAILRSVSEISEDKTLA